MYEGRSDEDLHFLPSNLVYVSTVQLCHFWTHCQIYCTRYVLLPHGDHLLSSSCTLSNVNLYSIDMIGLIADDWQGCSQYRLPIQHRNVK
jgi:hypothetical protein